MALCAGPALAQEPPEDLARSLVESALTRGDGSAELREWADGVLADALARARSVASETGRVAAGDGPETVLLPAEHHAAGLAAGPPDRPNTAEVLVFMSLAVPEAGWAQWAAQAARADAPLVLRGVSSSGLRATATEIGRRLDGHAAGVAVDPRLFRLFGVERVPAVIAVPGGVPACASRGCTEDAPPPFDAVAGNIGLVAALEAIAAEGAIARETALAHLDRLGRGP